MDAVSAVGDRKTTVLLSNRTNSSELRHPAVRLWLFNIRTAAFLSPAPGQAYRASLNSLPLPPSSRPGAVRNRQTCKLSFLLQLAASRRHPVLRKCGISFEMLIIKAQRWRLWIDLLPIFPTVFYKTIFMLFLSWFSPRNSRQFTNSSSSWHPGRKGGKCLELTGGGVKSQVAGLSVYLPRQERLILSPE